MQSGTSGRPDSPAPLPWEDLRGARIFLTGGTGFVGCHLVEAYLEAMDRRGYEGRLTLLTRHPQRFRDRAPHLASHARVSLHAGDQAGFEFPAEPHDLIIHAAVTYGDPLEVFQHNLQGTARTLAFAAACGARRVLFTSSGAVYGPQPAGLPRIEEDYLGAPGLAPASAYGEMKRASELLGLLHGARHGYAFLIARCFAFAGPYLPLAGGALGNFLADALAGRAIHVSGDGTPLRSYLHGRELAEWLWTILLRGEAGRPYNVGSETEVSIAELAERVRALVAPDSDVKLLGRPDAGAPRQRYLPSTARARMELGLAATIGLDEAILDTARWHRSQRGVSA